MTTVSLVLNNKAHSIPDKYKEKGDGCGQGAGIPAESAGGGADQEADKDHRACDIRCEQ